MRARVVAALSVITCTTSAARCKMRAQYRRLVAAARIGRSRGHRDQCFGLHNRWSANTPGCCARIRPMPPGAPRQRGDARSGGVPGSAITRCCCAAPARRHHPHCAADTLYLQARLKLQGQCRTAAERRSAHSCCRWTSRNLCAVRPEPIGCCSRKLALELRTRKLGHLLRERPDMILSANIGCISHAGFRHGAAAAALDRNGSMK